MTLFVTVISFCLFWVLFSQFLFKLLPKVAFPLAGPAASNKGEITTKAHTCCFLFYYYFFSRLWIWFLTQGYLFFAKNEVIWWLLAARSSPTHCSCVVTVKCCGCCAVCCRTAAPPLVLCLTPNQKTPLGTLGNPPCLPSLLPHTPTWSRRSVRQTFTIKAWNVLTSVSRLFLFCLFFCFVRVFFFF